MIYVGVDVGKKGGFAIIDDDLIATYPYNDQDFISFMSSLKEKKATACIEQVGAMPGQGVTSMFSFGKSAGFLEGVMQALGIKYQLVRPQTWKKEFGLNSSKQKSIDVCRKLFPNVSLLASERCRIPHDGMAEALLMAEYARRRM
jgi:hypothetical protein|nr:MAG TPA: HOLLIDAY JUNCTION RESOLVASE [Caudoviricetes sp.]